MNNYEYYDVLLSHPWLYGFLLVLSGLIHYLVFRRQIITLLDPYLPPVVFSAFSAATVLMLYLTGNISTALMASYAATQLAFFVGFSVFSSVKGRVIAGIRDAQSDPEAVQSDQPRSRDVIVLYLCMAILVATQLTVYALKGIPIFMISRLETFVGGSGLGILGRIIDLMTICCLYAFFSIVRFDRLRPSELLRYVALIIILVFFLLSGSKSGFLIIVQVLWAYLVFCVLKGYNVQKYLRIWNFIKRNLKKIVFAGLTVVLGIIFLQTNSNQPNASSPIFQLALRFIHSADIYWYAYPNDVYKSIPNESGFKALFLDMLGMLRIYHWEELPEAIGIILKNIHHPSDVVQGPNARHNVFGLVYFGWFGSIVFSFMVGVLISFVRNRLIFFLRRNAISGMIFCYLMVKITSFDSDPMLFFTYVNNLLFVFPLLMIPVFLLTSLVVVRKPV